MLSQAENELLTRVGPGTPAGELLRRYWHPVAVARELTEQNPTRFVRLLGEDLVLFRTPSPSSPPGGRGKGEGASFGLIGDHCPHRGASLLYGRVEERGIACAYHGWLYDTEGNCLETPAEPADSKLHLTVKHRAYPVQKFMGLFWAYLGPLPAPAIPQYDVWARKDGTRKLAVHPMIDCNWFQAMENSVDPAHLQVLHQEITGRGRTPPSTTRGFTDDVAAFDFYVFPHGIIKKRTYRNGSVDEHPLLFPTVLRVNNSTEIRVPVDDTHMMIFEPYFFPSPDGSIVVNDDDPPVEYLPPFKEPAERLHPFTRFRWDQVPAQDTAMWETQGQLADRERERLASTDKGIVLLREVMKENIARVQQGLDPLGLQRDPLHGLIDTRLEETLQLMRERGARIQVAELV